MPRAAICLGVLEDPRHPPLEGFSPMGGTAQPMVQAVHAAPFHCQFPAASVWGLPNLRTFDIVTRNVAKAEEPKVRPGGGSALSDYHPHPRLPPRARNTFAFSQPRSARLRLARRDDRAHHLWRMGRADVPGGMDTCGNPAHDYNVRQGGNADSVFPAAVGG